MIKIGKYEFVDEAQANSKIDALAENHPHAIVKLGNIIIEKGEEDAEGNEITPNVLSEKYHIDVMWKGIEEHPYGWKSYAVAVADDNGIHSFYGVDYQTNKM